jgi:hypothetical protein
MARIFISYRTEDARGHLGRLKEVLETRLPPSDIFTPSRDIEGGALFAEELKRAVRASETLVVLIGQYWLTRPNGEHRTLDAPDDYVRLEIATAMECNIKIIPVLVDGIEMPRQKELPAVLQPLASRQAISLVESDWAKGVEQLFEAVGATTKTRPYRHFASSWRLRAVASILSLVSIGGLWIASGQGRQQLARHDVFSIDLNRGVVVQTPGDIEEPISNYMANRRTYKIRRGGAVRIDVLQNPLLFTVDDRVRTSEDLAVASLLRQLDGLLDSVSESSVRTDRPVTVRGMGFDSLRADLTMIRSRYTSIDEDLAASLGTAAQVEALKRKIRDADIEALEGRVKSALAEVLEIQRACRLEGALLTTDDGSVIACDGPAAIALNIALTSKATAFRAKRERLATLEQAVASQPAVDDFRIRLAELRVEVEVARKDLNDARVGVGSLLRPTLTEYLSLITQTQPSVARQLEMLKRMQSEVATLGAAHTITTVEHRAGVQQVVTVTLGAHSEWDQFLDAATRQKRDSRLGKFTLTFVP